MAVLLDILAAGVVDDSGETLAGGIVYVYQVGTTTKVAVYSDVALTNPVSNPVTLDSAGKAEVYTETSVRLVIEDSLGGSVDDIESVGVTSAANELTDDLLPDVSDTRDIGSASKRLAEIHTNDLYVYDDAFIETLVRVGASNPGWINNLSVELQAGVFRIVGSDGTVLSTDNPGYVSCQSTTAGRPQVLKVTSGGSFNDDTHASSDLTNLGFGITEASNWANDMPFFLYVVNRGNTDIDGADGSSAFFIARQPNLSTTPSAANDIGDTGGISVNDTQSVILILDDVTVANYTSLPCQIIGAFRMQWASATTDWTVQTLGNNDGLGATQLSKTFATQWTYPVAQNGAATATHLLNNGGTAPQFSTNFYLYKLNPEGSCNLRILLDGNVAVDGIGAVDARVSMPYTNSVTQSIDSALVKHVSAGGGTKFLTARPAASAVYFDMRDSAGVFITNGNFSDGNRNIVCSLTYWPF